ncbi:MAG: slipin family protein [Flavobacteriaceae bacterium]
MLRKITIKAQQVGLVFQNNKLEKVLKEGNYWILGNKVIYLFEMSQPFFSSMELNVLLKNDELAEMLEVVEVADNEIVLQIVNGNFREVLTAGRYAFWKGVMQYKFIKADISQVEISEDIPKFLLEQGRMRAFVRRFNVQNNEKALLFVNGEFIRELKPGTYYFWQNFASIEVKTIDLRLQQMEIAGQELLTKDKATLRINFFVRYQVSNIMKALLENKDSEKQLYLLMQLALRSVVSSLTLDELLVQKEAIGKSLLETMYQKFENLGLKVNDAGVRDIILPGDMKEIMNQVLVAEKKAQANSIMRREETASTRSLLNTAKLMEENEMLWKLKEMEYVEKIADKIGEITISGGSNAIGQLKEIFVK